MYKTPPSHFSVPPPFPLPSATPIPTPPTIKIPVQGKTKLLKTKLTLSWTVLVASIYWSRRSTLMRQWYSGKRARLRGKNTLKTGQLDAIICYWRCSFHSTIKEKYMPGLRAKILALFHFFFHAHYAVHLG
jgi:hypothetical protein